MNIIEIISLPLKYFIILAGMPFFFIITGCNTILLYDDVETIELLQNVFNEAQYYTYDNETGIYDVYISQKNKIGYAFYAEGMGEEVMTSDGGKIAGPIIILVGIKNDKETISKICVIEQNESYLFWKLLITENYLDQFIDLKIEDAYFKSNGGKVDVVTGATLSSNSILNIVRETAIAKIDLFN